VDPIPTNWLNIGLTRRVAVYLGTHCNIGSIEERVPPTYSTGDTTVYLFTDASCLVPAFDDTKCHVS